MAHPGTSSAVAQYYVVENVLLPLGTKEGRKKEKGKRKRRKRHSQGKLLWIANQMASTFQQIVLAAFCQYWNIVCDIINEKLIDQLINQSFVPSKDPHLQLFLIKCRELLPDAIEDSKTAFNLITAVPLNMLLTEIAFPASNEMQHNVKALKPSRIWWLTLEVFNFITVNGRTGI